MGKQLPAVIRVSNHPSLRAWLKTGTVMGRFGRPCLSLAKESFTLAWFLALSPLSLGWSLMLFWLRRKKQKMPSARSSSHCHGPVPVEAILEDKLRPYQRGGLLEVRHRFGVPRLVNVTCTAAQRTTNALSIRLPLQRDAGSGRLTCYRICWYSEATHPAAKQGQHAVRRCKKAQQQPRGLQIGMRRR